MNREDARENGIIGVMVRKLLGYMKDVNVNIYKVRHIDENTIEVEYIVPVTIKDNSKTFKRHSIVNENSTFKQMREKSKEKLPRMPYRTKNNM